MILHCHAALNGQLTGEIHVDVRVELNQKPVGASPSVPTSALTLSAALRRAVQRTPGSREIGAVRH